MTGASDVERQLHDRLLRGDAAAPLIVLEQLAPRVTDRVQKRFPWIEYEVVHDASVDACLVYAGHPERYDPDRLGLESYLVMSATGDVMNLVRRLSRERPQQEVVEKRLRLTEHKNVTPDPAIALVDRLEASAVLKRLAALFPDPEEVAVLELMLDGERETAPYASALGLNDRPVEEQRRLVKQAKDRITKRLERSRPSR